MNISIRRTDLKNGMTRTITIKECRSSFIYYFNSRLNVFSKIEELINGRTIYTTEGRYKRR